MQVKTKNLLLGGIVGALVLFLWYSQIYSKMESQASKAKSTATEAKSQATSLRQQLDGEVAKKKKNGTGPSNAQMVEAIPNDPAEAAFFRNVDQIRVASGAAWDSISPSATVPGQAFNSNSVTIKVGGTEDQVARYITGLSNLKRVFVLDNVTINGGSAAPAGSPAAAGHAGATFIGDIFTATLTGRIFSQPTSAAIAGSVGAGAGGTTPVTGAPAPNAGGSGPTVQNN